MPAKTPIYLKPNNSKKGKKCRLRDILSPDMISPPLGDFRHTIHIGRGGERDAFGDMSFLQGRFELLAGKGDVPRPQYGLHGEFLRANSASEASFAETPSPVLKNAISLPSIGGCQALTLPLLSAAVFALPPAPLEDLVGTKIPMSAAQRSEELEILQMDALLRSMDIFSSDPAPKPAGNQLKPDVLLDLLEQPDVPSKKDPANSNNTHSSGNSFEKMSTCYVYEGVNGNTGLNGNGVYGSFHGNVNIKNMYNDDGSLSSEDSPKTNCHVININGHRRGIAEGNRGINGNGNGNCNGYSSGYGGGDITLCYEEDGSDCGGGDWADRDSGVEEEGRVSDFDFDFHKEKSVSHESLCQITGSLLSLELDLGPSILDEVLHIMDKPLAKSRP